MSDKSQIYQFPNIQLNTQKYLQSVFQLLTLFKGNSFIGSILAGNRNYGNKNLFISPDRNGILYGFFLSHKDIVESRRERCFENKILMLLNE